jgi:hypothetical protein
VPLITDLAKSDSQRQILKLIFGRQTMGRPFAAPPGLPADRRQALRIAFDRTVKDADFLAEAGKRKLEINPVSGADIDSLIADIYSTPKDVVAEARAAPRARNSALPAVGLVEEAHHPDAAFLAVQEIDGPHAVEACLNRRQPMRMGLAVAPLGGGDDLVAPGARCPGGLRDDVVARSAAHASLGTPSRSGRLRLVVRLAAEQQAGGGARGAGRRHDAELGQSRLEGMDQVAHHDPGLGIGGGAQQCVVAQEKRAELGRFLLDVIHHLPCWLSST